MSTHSAQPRKGDLGIIVTLFVLLYGYDVAEAIINLQQLPLLYEALDLAGSVPWAVLVIGVIAPVLCFAAAMWFGRGKGLVARAGYLLLGLAVSACASLLLEELARVAAAAALGGVH